MAKGIYITEIKFSIVSIQLRITHGHKSFMFLSIQKPMSLSEMWHTFCEAKQEFIPNYIAYHYFRSKGWVPKLGIKYGTDLGKLLDLVVCLSHTNKIKLYCITTKQCLIIVLFFTRQYVGWIHFRCNFNFWFSLYFPLSLTCFHILKPKNKDKLVWKMLNPRST